MCVYVRIYVCKLVHTCILKFLIVSRLPFRASLELQGLLARDSAMKVEGFKVSEIRVEKR